MKIEFDYEKHEYKADGIIVPSVSQIISEVLQLDHSWCSFGSAEKGTSIHEYCNLFDAGLSLQMLQKYEWNQYIKAWELFKKENMPFIDYIEEIFISNKYRYAGTIDRILTIDNKKYVVDIKSGQKQKWHGIQLAAYRLLADIDDSFCVYLSDDGTYKIDNFKKREIDYIGIWKSILNVYNFKKGRL